jgi:hypothetical protein
MINGFIIEIINSDESDKEITLFTDQGLTESIEIRGVNSDYEYANLSLMAKTKGFVGCGISTNYENELQVRYINGLEEETISIDSILTNKRINLNGTSNYLILTAPASSTFVFQLLPLLLTTNSLIA